MSKLTREEFRRLASEGILLDGALGTELAKAGMPAGCCPELWCMEHEDAFVKIQNSYRAAGTRLLYSPTFGCNRAKLSEFGFDEHTLLFAEELVRFSKNNAGKETLVFGDMAPTGQFVEPYGKLSFDEAENIYFEVAEAMLRGGADGFVIETMMDLQEARAAYLGARRAAPDAPIMVTMTFEQTGRTLTGVSPLAALTVFQSLGADAFGCNCSTGPAEMARIIASLHPYAKIPLIAKPNAGIPRYVDGKTVFPMGPEEFASYAEELRMAGASLIGGCCGTSPAHIEALGKALKGKPLPVGVPLCGIVASPSETLEISCSSPLMVIGERINPTGKKALQAELREGQTNLVFEFAQQQQEAGAAMLDVNMGLSGIDEADMMRRTVSRIVPSVRIPLCIDTTDAATAEAALRLYPGRALFNSITAEQNRLEKVLPVVAKYKPMLILLPVTDKGIPGSAVGRIEVIRGLLDKVAEYGYGKDEICVDALIMTVSADPEAANVSLDVISWCKAEGIATVCGLSNVSFGLPARRTVNQAFLGMAAGRGLTAAIANPLFPEIMDAVAALNALNGKDARQADFIARFANAAAEAPAQKTLSPEENVRQMVLRGNSDKIIEGVELLLKQGMAPMEIIGRILIPAITEVGGKYEAKEYFLPQLMSGAEAMQKATAYLEPMISGDGSVSRGRLIFATVKGDIHDIGKNIVIVMLKNYGFEVVDLGKDVPPNVILDRAQKENIKVIALSALMTTTMGSMKETVELARARGMECTFLVGGAVVDQQFADEIGAIYTPDPMGTVRACQKLFG